MILENIVKENLTSENDLTFIGKQSWTNKLNVGRCGNDHKILWSIIRKAR